MLEYIKELLQKKNWKALIVGGVTMFMGPWLFTYTTAAIGNYLVFPMLQAEIETTRAMLTSVPCDPRVVGYQAPIGNATTFNIRIAHEQEALRHLYSRYFITKKWAGVQKIVLPCGRK